MSKLTVGGSFYTSNDPDNREGWSLRVEDDLSSVVLADISIRPEDFFALMRGGVIHVEGRIGNDLHRVGKKMRNWSKMVPRDVSGYGKEAEERSRVWAEANAGEPYDTLELRKQNNGINAIYRVWEEIE